MFRIATLAGLLLLTQIVAIAEGEGLSFNRDIKPILSDKCFTCHGPAAREDGTELRLDLRDSAVTDLEAIIPGKPEESELIRRIESSDHGELMPPPEAHKPLNDGERALLRQWIAGGAGLLGGSSRTINMASRRSNGSCGKLPPPPLIQSARLPSFSGAAC